MQFLILGLALLVLGLICANYFMQANPKALARQLRQAGATLLIAAGAVLAVRGLINYALPLFIIAAGLLLRPGKTGFGRSAPKSPGQTSRVTTEYLEMELDHDTGQMRGQILKGLFAGRKVEDLKPAEMALLWQDCKVDDPQSAQLIEAYLDATHPSWRDDVRRGEEQMSSGPDGRMSAEEAYEILGLSPGATSDDIRQAHRELIIKFHPDHGGSTYLAAKINEAKDVLLGQS